MKRVFLIFIIVCCVFVGCIDDNQNSIDTLTESNEQNEESESQEIIQDNNNKDLETISSEYESDDKKVLIIANVLNVRQDKTTESEIIDNVYEYDIYEIKNEGKDTEDRIWYKISTNSNIVGWVAGWYCVDINDYRKSLHVAYNGKIDGIDFSLGTNGKDIIEQWGKPLSEGYFAGGLYMQYDEIVFLTDGYMKEDNTYKYGEVKIMCYRGESSVFGIRNGMILDDIVEIIGEPDYVSCNRMDDSELYGDDLLAGYNTGNYRLILRFEDDKSPLIVIYLEYQQDWD